LDRDPTAPLLTGARTGYANPGCYARRSNDCDHELTREHFITDDLLEIVSHDGKVVIVEGAAWQAKADRQKTIGRSALASRVLCNRHNAALSPLDKMAADFFRYFLEDQLDIFKYLGNDDREEFARGFIMVSGPYLELWLLNVLWGAIEAGASSTNETQASEARARRPNESTAEISRLSDYSDYRDCSSPSPMEGDPDGGQFCGGQGRARKVSVAPEGRQREHHRP